MKRIPLMLLMATLFFLPLVPPGMKNGLAILLCCAFAVSLQYQKSETTDRNKWISTLMVFLPISIFCAPQVHAVMGKYDLGGSWMWLSLAWCFGYYLVYTAVFRICLCRDKDKARIGAIIGITGILSAIYAVLQWLNLDQFQYVLDRSIILGAEKPDITAMIGNSTFLGVFLVACLPFVPGWWRVLVMFSAILCGSDTAYAGMFIMVMGYLAHKYKFLRVASVVMCVLILVCGMWMVGTGKYKPNFNGRATVWNETIDDWKSVDDHQKGYSLTGQGLGSFAVFHEIKHPSGTAATWRSAHCEPLEILYSIGLFGFVLFFGAILFVVLKYFFFVGEQFYLSCYASFLFLCFSSLTLPVWHQEPSRMMSVILFAILSRKINQK